MKITLTPQERAAGALSEENVQRAADAIRNDGYVVLADVIDTAHLDVLRERMAADSQTLIDAGKWGGAGRIEGHLQQGAPPIGKYVFSDVVANPFAIQVSHAVLGDGFYNRFYNGNANCPGSGTQPLHADAPHLWTDPRSVTESAHPPASLVLNVTLVDATEENGATEIWPGTHRIPMAEQHVSAEMEAARRREVPPVRAITNRGDLLMRDMRMWHRGVPNRSNEIRHMIAMVHNIRWLQRSAPLLFQRDCASAFPDSVLDHNVQFTDEPLEYLFTRTPTIVSKQASVSE